MDKKLGIVYRFSFMGNEVKVNHCLVARVLIAMFIVGAALSVIWIASH